MHEGCEYYFKTKWKGVQECISEDNDISFIIEKNRFKRKRSSQRNETSI